MLAYGTTGVAAAVALLMVLTPVSAGGVGAAITLTPAYKGTANQPFQYSSFSGCAKAKAGVPAWHATSGTIVGTLTASAKTCGKSLGSVGAYSSAYGENGVEVGVPFHAAHNGNNSIHSSWTVTIASTAAFTTNACPAKNVNYAPALYQYSYAFCEDGANYQLEIYSNVVDLNNNSWYANYSYGFTYNNSGWENYTDCYNYGTPTCYNNTGPYSSSFAYGYNEAGMSTFNWNGATSISLWNNGTNMVKTHHYLLAVEVYLYGGAYAEKANLLGAWSGTASMSINMGTLGNGATLSSVVIS